jgi:hypothetical protein
MAMEETMHAASRRTLVLVALIAASAAGLSAGGWSVITLTNFPDYAMAGKRLTLTFTVRQHGNNLISGLKPAIHASVAGGAAMVAHAKPTSNPGEYSASLVLDTVGDWAITIDGGFNPEDKGRGYNSIALPPLRVIRAGSAPLVLFSDAERGASLMVTKGCVSCHAPGSDRDVTRKRLASSYVKMLLADPSVRQIEMPNLRLSPGEITSLAAFVSRDEGVARR